MKKLLIKSFCFFIVVLLIVWITLSYYGGYVDYFYNKFTTPRVNSLIMGDSRSFQGIQPNEIDSYFKNSNFNLPILNYSFTLNQIAYGEPYNKSILKKIDQTQTNGLFIVTVHPFMLSNRSGGNKEEAKGIFFEANMPPHNMCNVTSSPNFEYFFKNFKYFHFRGIFRKSSKTHKNGWLEEKNLPSDSILLNQWKQGQIKLYTRYSKEWVRSEERLKYLDDLISVLTNQGNVFLLRLPISDEMMDIENSYWNNFNDEMKVLSKKYKAPYINFNISKHKFNTYDGIHLDKFIGAPFTVAVCDSINKYLKE